MSTGLMSCVRENSPPLEMAGSESGASSLPNNALDLQKRRRFHPLRNLRRIFRRRTLSGADTPSRSVSSTPSSPSYQSSSTPPNVIASVPAQNSLCSQGGILPVDVTTMSSAAYPPHLISLAGNRDVGSCGLTIGAPYKITTSASGGFYAKSLRENSDNVFNRGRDTLVTVADNMDDNRDMMDYQRSLSEGRLVDSDFSRDKLSQSHDSVFSESATASSLSLGLKAELFDVLRKRRNRPDASEEDLGLPHSPTTPQRKKLTVNHTEVSSLSLLSMASSELDDELTSNYGVGDKTTSSYSSSKYSQDTSRTSDEVDLDISAENRLSHAAAHHKMAVRPKKKGPTRHRRPIDASVLPSTPEVNEDSLKLSLLDVKDFFPEKQKTKSHSLPPGVNAKILDLHSTKTVKEVSTNITRSKTETSSISSTCVAQTVRNEIEQTCSSSTSTLERKDEEGGFFKRFLHRSSKKIKKSLDEGDHAEESLPTISIDKYEIGDEKTATTETKKELTAEIKSGLSALLNSMMVPSGHERAPIETAAGQKLQKPKSGPAARQRILPQDLTASPLPENKLPELNPSVQLIESEKQQTVQQIAASPEKPQIFKTNRTFQMENSVKLSSMTKLSKSVDETRIPRLKVTREEPVATMLFTHEHFEKKERVQPKIVGLSPFQQKISRAEPSTVDQTTPAIKQRKSVEKSKSFRCYSEDADNSVDTSLKKRENMPSLPDLTTSRKSMDLDDLKVMTSPRRLESPLAPMGFEINDNNLIKLRRHEEPLPLTQGIYTKNIILSTAKPNTVSSTHISPACNQNITEIEDNIDKLVKAPFVTVLKSGELNEMKCVSNVSTTIIRKSETFESKEFTQTVLQSREKSSKSVSTELLNKLDLKSNENVQESIEQKAVTLSTDTKFDKKLTLELIETKSDSNLREAAVTSPTKARRSSAIFEKPEDVQVPEFMKIQLNRVDSARPKSNVVLAKNVKETDERDLTRRFSNESVEITDTKPPLPPDNVANNPKRGSITSITKLAEDVTLKPQIKKVDEENNVLKNAENTQPPAIERRRSGTDEKPKYLKKIEDQKAEKRKSAVEDNRRSIDEETGVILRKKSFSANNQSSNKEDTPELMKVFARRSLKIKDTDDVQSFDEPERTTSSLKKSTNLDSDKENQSSSEEKLDKLPKIEITIQQPKVSLQNGQLAQKNDDKIRNIITTTSKPFVQPIRYSAVTTYRSLSTVFGESKKVAAPFTTTTTTATPTTTAQTAGLEQTTITTDENERNNNNHNTNSTNNIRHTIGVSSPITTKSNRRDDGEFKGILQRRAEWEKRAKEASK